MFPPLFTPVKFTLIISIIMGFLLIMQEYHLVGLTLPLVVWLAIASRSIRQTLIGPREPSHETDTDSTTPDVDSRVLAELTVPDHLTRDNFQTVYQVSHAQEYGFGGDTTMWVAVEDETETEITGRKITTDTQWPKDRVVIQKSNVSGWSEATDLYDELPIGIRGLSESEVEEAYKADLIDESELEDQIEEVLTNE